MAPKYPWHLYTTPSNIQQNTLNPRLEFRHKRADSQDLIHEYCDIRSKELLQFGYFPQPIVPYPWGAILRWTHYQHGTVLVHPYVKSEERGKGWAIKYLREQSERCLIFNNPGLARSAEKHGIWHYHLTEDLYVPEYVLAAKLRLIETEDKFRLATIDEALFIAKHLKYPPIVASSLVALRLLSKHRESGTQRRLVGDLTPWPIIHAMEALAEKDANPYNPAEISEIKISLDKHNVYTRNLLKVHAISQYYLNVLHPPHPQTNPEEVQQYLENWITALEIDFPLAPIFAQLDKSIVPSTL